MAPLKFKNCKNYLFVLNLHVSINEMGFYLPPHARDIAPLLDIGSAVGVNLAPPEIRDLVDFLTPIPTKK